MHLDTIGFLLKAVNDDAKTDLQSSLVSSVHPDDEIGVHLLVNAISAKQYSLASKLVKKFPQFASKGDDVLMAIAKTFPSELHYWETLIYPSLFISWGEVWEMFCLVALIAIIYVIPDDIALKEICIRIGVNKTITEIIRNMISLVIMVFVIVPGLLAIAFLLIIISIFSQLYSYCWKGATILYWRLQMYSIREQVQHYNYNVSFNGVRK
ncbi:hypothetical protein L1987_01623 [Smallanthus sonchifolius]|uniref:Uncharacterized protein n=1 Tax=Smallanthus sonchifolius TaxID=185202 RepID=A0ACB9K5Q8_9ASTR|nr:hypothetical protein L1987_01623 [Smallanthus sonchifolius]